MPLVVRVPGGIARQLAAQHAQRLEHTLMNVPGLRIVVPATPQDAYWQLRQAIASDDPIIVLEHELLYFTKGTVDLVAQAPPMHRAAVRREGRDLTIVSYSRHAVLAQEAANELAKENIEAEISRVEEGMRRYRRQMVLRDVIELTSAPTLPQAGLSAI